MSAATAKPEVQLPKPNETENSSEQMYLKGDKIAHLGIVSKPDLLRIPTAFAIHQGQARSDVFVDSEGYQLMPEHKEEEYYGRA